MSDVSDSGPIWRQEGRAPTVGEARIYFDLHAEDGGDPETMEECEHVLDATDQPSLRIPRPSGSGTIPPPTEDQLEERGSD